MKVISIAAAISIACVPLASFAAGTSTGNVVVNANVAANCTLLTNDLYLGNYDPLVKNASLDLSGSTQIVVACTKGSNPILVVAPLLSNASPVVRSDAPGSIGSSTMNEDGSGGGSLDYTFGLDTPTVTTGLSAPTTWTLTATVAHGQDQSVGHYEDTLSVAVNF